jgi:tRNA threonylcarbamoyladenosine biosynthesis protein TsaB
MKLLLIDTCGAMGSIALADVNPSQMSSDILASEILPGRSASERLVPAIRLLIEGAGVGLDSLGAIAVVHGPGSFTGVRVGVSAAKGLCEALGVPLIAVSKLAVIAETGPLSLPDQPHGQPTCVLLDAGRGEFYYGEYLHGVCRREALLTREQVVSIFTSLDRPAFLCCEAAVAESLSQFGPRLVAEPSAGSALPIALRRMQQGDLDEVATLDANYVRRTDAEIFAKPTPARTPAVPGPPEIR